MPHFEKKYLLKYIPSLTALLCAAVFFLQSLSAAAYDSEAALEANRALPIQSDEIANWPAGPVIGAESAILIEARTGAVLYAKNIHRREYPASTTKIMTTLLATELCDMDELVTFSHDAVFDNPPGSSGIAMDVGQAMTMEQCLNAILIRSANEVAFAVAEHISGTSDWSVFADTMNQRAAQLGALDTHFANPNGLPDENHYTTAYDLAMIGRAFFANEMLCRISLTRRLDIPASPTLPKAKLEISSMQIIPGGTYAYKYLTGCKTGYTEAARYCLVSCAEKDGLKLICVVMRDENPYQYLDTISLFDYGFSNFEKVYPAQEETRYNLTALSLSAEDYVVLPRTVSFEELDSSITYEEGGGEQAALITYSYQGTETGTVAVSFSPAARSASPYSPLFDTASENGEKTSGSPVIFIDLAKILAVFAVLAVLALVAMLLHSFLRNYQFSGRRPGSGRRRSGRWKRD